MAHFAELDANDVVLRVVVVDNDRCGDDPALEEQQGIAYLHGVLGNERTWIQTSYTGRTRKQYAGIGYTYNRAADVFVQPQPFPSWTLDANFDWQPPKPCPGIEPEWAWNEDEQEWLPF